MGSYCTNCGTRVKATDRYCPVCGNSLDDYGRDIPQEQSGYSDKNSYNEPEDVKERTNTGRVIAIIGALFVIAASFLPYVSYDVLGLGEAITLMEHGDGIIFLIAAIFALLLFCVKSKVLALLSAIVVGVMAWYGMNIKVRWKYLMGWEY